MTPVIMAVSSTAHSVTFLSVMDVTQTGEMKMFRVKMLALLLCSFVMFGCAGNLGLTKGQTSIDVSSNSLVLLPVTVSNQNHTGFQPDLVDAYLRLGTDSQRIGTKDSVFKEDKDKSKDYLMSFSLKPGTYTIEKIIGSYRIPMIIKAWCQIPMDKSFEVKANSVVYLGHVSATIVERKNDDQERAGGMIPLMDQGIAGFSTGTFVVDIADRYESDMANYRSEFPGLKDTKVEKAVLTSQVKAAKN